MSFLLDTNIVSELRKGVRCNRGVAIWHRSLAADSSYLSVLVVGELRRGVELLRRRDPSSGARLDQWLDRLAADYAERLLPVDASVADCWGRLSVPDPVPAVDGLMAATALVHDLTLVTRNTADVGRTGARLLNPFD